MVRQTRRRLILTGLVLVAGGVWLLIGKPWAPTPEPQPAPLTKATPQRPTKVELPGIEVTAPSVAPPSSSPAQRGFRGRVIDAATRQSIKEFQVQLIRVRRDLATEEAPITRNFTSATGRFTWTDVTEGTWRAAVLARGYQMFNIDEMQISEGESPSEIVMPLLRGYAIHGRVFELSTGAGIAGASISFRRTDALQALGRRENTTRSNPDGAFTLSGLPGGHVVLAVGAPDHAFRELEILVDDSTPAQQIALSSGATIAGIVTTTEGLPVKGRVILSGPGLSYVGETNEAGQFSFDSLSSGRYKVSADTSAGSAMQVLVVAQDEIKQDITLMVGGGRSVRGTLRGLPAKQLQDAHILLRSQSGGTAFSTTPDERQAFALHGVPAGRAVIMVSTGDLRMERQVDVPADRDVTIDFEFPAGARLSGRVTQGGKPAANRIIWVNPVAPQSDVYYRAKTAADGQYEIEGLAAGDYRLRADEDISRAITISGDAVLNIDIPTVQLSARVIEDGSLVPIVGAQVYVRGTAPETMRVRLDKHTDDFGRFALTGIEAGEIVLMVYQPGYELHRQTLEYSSPIIDKTITLRKSAGVEVRVQAGSRRFPRGFTLTQRFPPNDLGVDLWMPMDSEGVCRVPGALAGTTFEIGRFSGEPIVVKDWDGQPFELP